MIECKRKNGDATLMKDCEYTGLGLWTIELLTILVIISVVDHDDNRIDRVYVDDE
jgi:hypothetical protein